MEETYCLCAVYKCDCIKGCGCPVQADAESIYSTDECTPLSLSVDVERAALQTNIPVNCLEEIWKKALDLIRTTCS